MYNKDASRPINDDDDGDAISFVRLCTGYVKCTECTRTHLRYVNVNEISAEKKKKIVTEARTFVHVNNDVWKQFARNIYDITTCTYNAQRSKLHWMVGGKKTEIACECTFLMRAADKFHEWMNDVGRQRLDSDSILTKSFRIFFRKIHHSISCSISEKTTTHFRMDPLWITNHISLRVDSY